MALSFGAQKCHLVVGALWCKSVTLWCACPLRFGLPHAQVHWFGMLHTLHAECDKLHLMLRRQYWVEKGPELLEQLLAAQTANVRERMMKQVCGMWASLWATTHSSCTCIR